MEDLQRARAPRAYVLTAEGSDFVAPPACATLPPFPLHPASAPFRLHLHPQAAIAMLAEVLRVIGYRLAEANRLQHKFPSLAAEMRADAARLERLSIKLKAMRDAGRLYISKDDIPPIEFSLWRWILTRGSEGAMIRFTGLSRALFNELVLLASQAEGWTERVDYYAAPGAGGKRKRGGQLLMGGADCMALALRYIFGYVAHHVEQLRVRPPPLSFAVLHYFACAPPLLLSCSTCESVGLMGCFHVSSSTISSCLNKGFDFLLYALERHPDAAVKWPDFATQLRYMKMIAENGFIKLDTGLTARRPGCFVDGAVWPVEKGTNKEVERMNWCSKHHITGVNNVFAFGPDAEIIWEIVNAPGSWNDTDLCRGLTVVLNDVTMTLPEFCALADVAFKGEGCETAYLTLASAAAMSLTKKAGDVAALCHWLLKKRNAVEWCMATLKMTFRRLTTVNLVFMGG